MSVLSAVYKRLQSEFKQGFVIVSYYAWKINRFSCCFSLSMATYASLLRTGSKLFCRIDNQPMTQRTNINLPLHTSFARELRKTQTPEEKIMWDKLRGRRLSGYKFLRQHPIIVNKFNERVAFYIADFYCAEKKLVVEIDGLIHALQIDYDKARDTIVTEMGLRIIRLQNEEINTDVYAALGK